MSVDLNVRDRILKAVEDVRKAAAKQKEAGEEPRVVSIQEFRANNCRPALRAVPKETPSKLNLMLPKPHTSIW
jgi:hypothetical protein